MSCVLGVLVFCAAFSQVKLNHDNTNLIRTLSFIQFFIIFQFHSALAKERAVQQSKIQRVSH